MPRYKENKKHKINHTKHVFVSERQENNEIVKHARRLPTISRTPSFTPTSPNLVDISAKLVHDNYATTTTTDKNNNITTNNKNNNNHSSSALPPSNTLEIKDVLIIDNKKNPLAPLSDKTILLSVESNQQKESTESIAYPFDLFALQQTQKQGNHMDRMELRRMYRSLPEIIGDCSKPNCRQYFVNEFIKTRSLTRITDIDNKSAPENVAISTNLTRIHDVPDSLNKGPILGIVSNNLKNHQKVISTFLINKLNSVEKNIAKVRDSTSIVPHHGVLVPLQDINKPNMLANPHYTRISDKNTNQQDETLKHTANITTKNATTTNTTASSNKTTTISTVSTISKTTIANSNSTKESVDNNNDKTNPLNIRIANIEESIKSVKPTITLKNMPFLLCDAKQVKNTLLDPKTILYSLVFTSVIYDRTLLLMQVCYKDSQGRDYIDVDNIKAYMYKQYILNGGQEKSQVNVFMNIDNIAFPLNNIIPPHVRLGYQVYQSAAVREHLTRVKCVLQRNDPQANKKESIETLRYYLQHRRVSFSNKDGKVASDSCRVCATIANVESDRNGNIQLVLRYNNNAYKKTIGAASIMRHDYISALNRTGELCTSEELSKLAMTNERALKYLHVKYGGAYHRLNTIITPSVLSGATPYYKDEPNNPLVFTRYQVQFENRFKSDDKIQCDNRERALGDDNFVVCAFCRFPFYKQDLEKWWCKPCYEKHVESNN
jgi:hypothetical protein